MAIIMEILIWLFIESVIAFVFYSTGSIILKVTTLGKYNAEYNTFATFKGSTNKNFNLPFIIGLCFYITLLVLWVKLK